MNDIVNEKLFVYFEASYGKGGYLCFITNKRILMVNAKAGRFVAAGSATAVIFTLLFFLPLFIFNLFTNPIFFFIYFCIYLILGVFISYMIGSKTQPRHVQSIKRITGLISKSAQDELPRLLKELAV
ncbi:hypothetical protein, partial [Archaeoglobus sp.]